MSEPSHPSGWAGSLLTRSIRPGGRLCLQGKCRIVSRNCDHGATSSVLSTTRNCSSSVREMTGAPPVVANESGGRQMPTGETDFPICHDLPVTSRDGDNA